MPELNLPKLPENYRWRVEKSDLDPDYEAVNLYLEKVYQCWWKDYWRPIHGKYIRHTLLDETLSKSVEQHAQNMYDMEFDQTEAGRIAGIYGND